MELWIQNSDVLSDTFNPDKLLLAAELLRKAAAQGHPRAMYRRKKGAAENKNPVG